MRLLFKALCLALVCQLSYAITPVGAEVNLYGGISKVDGGQKSVFFNSAFPEHDTLVKDSESNYNFIGGGGIAYNFLMDENNSNSLIHDVSIGLDYYGFNTSVTGDVLQFGVLHFNNFDYDFNIETQRLMLDAQLNFRPLKNKMMLFVVAGIGAANVKAQYYDTPNLVHGTSGGGINLPSNTEHNTAYSVGAGFRIPVTQKIHVSLSYLYTDLGSATTGSASIPFASGTIQPVTMQVHTQTGLVGINYAFH